MNNLPTIAAHAKQYGIIAKKSLGQNFLLDANLCNKIARIAGDIQGKEILEIGPGIGGLTRAILAHNPKRLVVIEKDQRCLLLLNDIKNHYPQLEIIVGDALDYSLTQLTAERFTILANLPYNISTVLVCKWIREVKNIDSIVVMLQKEVADRIGSASGCADYGRLSIICQLTCAVSQHLTVNPAAFYPPPKVFSSITKLIPHAQQLEPKLLDMVEMVTRIAFNQRRKMLKSALKTLSPFIEQILLSLGISPSLRPEQLAPSAYILLAEQLALSSAKTLD